MIEAELIYDKAAMTALMKFGAVSRPWRWLLYAFATAFASLAYILSFGTGYAMLFLATLLIVVFLDILVLYAYFLMPTIKLKDFEKNETVSNRFVFNQDEILIYSKRGGKSSTSKIGYSNIFKACEGKEYFFLFINKTSALIIKKNGIKNGGASDLRAFLSSKIHGKRNKLQK